MPAMTCPFCDRIAGGRLTLESSSAVAFSGCLLGQSRPHHVVPRRHVAGFFDLNPEDQAEMWVLVSRVREMVLPWHAAPGTSWCWPSGGV